jgi:hypothetical protein
MYQVEITKNQYKLILMRNNPTTKPRNVDYFCVPRQLWRCVRRLLPVAKAVKRAWFGVCSSTLHQRFQE